MEEIMRKLLSIILATAMCMAMFAGCSSNEPEAPSVASGSTPPESSGPEAIEIETLTIGFVPSRTPEEIVTVTEPLKALLQAELATFGYDVDNVEITVGTSNEVVGEGLIAGTIDVGMIPGGTYVMYDDGAEVILTAIRDALSIDSDSPQDWNDNKPTTSIAEPTVSYPALFIAGPSEKGQALAAKVAAGEDLTWEELNDATWNVTSSTSPAGYIYPSLWLQDNYGKSITDLEKAVQADSYGNAFESLAAEETDILVCYADARNDNEKSWEDDFEREASIWDETNVIGVTTGIYNDTISVSTASDIMDSDFTNAITEAFINIGNSEEGKEIITIYNHRGYQRASSKDYDDERAAQKLIQELNG